MIVHLCWVGGQGMRFSLAGAKGALCDTLSLLLVTGHRQAEGCGVSTLKCCVCCDARFLASGGTAAGQQLQAGRSAPGLESITRAMITPV